MLQPRLFGCALKMRNFAISFVCAVILSSALVSSQEVNNESIEATRIKREGILENRDLTVLLVNDQKRNDNYNSKVGRYHSVKPLIGLLTSTARTFIQDGVTTEFATQILGTTLNNGRIYAQLLTKSSLVLYNKPANEDAVEVKPTRVHSAFDGQWSVKQDLGFIDPDQFVLKNTDYLAPNSRMEIVYASKAAQEVKFWTPSSPEQDNQVFEEPTARRVQPNNEIPRYVQNEAYNYLDGPSVDSERKYEFVVKPAILENINALHRQNKAFEPVTEPIKIDSRIKEELNESNIVKVKPNYDLPTFTIKNEFSPIFYYIDNVESRTPPQPAGQQTKIPKRLFGQKSEARPKKTFTYAGFADFTTVVGDTVIVFTPNTDIARPQSPDEVNVFPSAKHVDKLNTKITFLAADIPVATATYKSHELHAATKITTPSSENSSEKVLYNDEDSLQKVHYEVDAKFPDGASGQNNNGFDFNLDVIQPSEAAVPTTESTRLTDNLGVIPIHDYNSKATDPLITLKPSATIIEEPKESAFTESTFSEDLVTSEEESDNTAAEVTEKNEEEEEEVEEEITPENQSDVAPTTDSGHSEESFEDIETTTETKHNIEEEVICSSGLETRSTMTTAYKTLTYLTTYFIPLESSITTTSVKSHVVVESNVGYLTNVACKSHMNIEPTAVVKVNVQSSVHNSLESPNVETEESVTSPPTQPDVVTEAAPKTTPKDNEVLTTIEDKEEENETTVEENSAESEKNNNEKELTTASTSTTTTERISTSQSHVEVSVSTEHSTTPTEKPEADKEEDAENEIDLIYKTLYTTYTYFTTFFGDQTSSVASHKSIVTNVITSTINLAKLDPSLLGAFDEDEIAPTNVGIGRPTESFAINSIIDLVKNKDVLESVQIGESYNSQTPTPSLGDDVASIKPDAVKTYFTTYTFFTTIYVGTDANVCSRSEVYTNYVGPDELIPTKSNPLGAGQTKAQFDFRNCKQTKREPQANPEDTSSIETSVSMEENDDIPSKDGNKDEISQPSPVEVDMLFSVPSNPLDTESSYVTDVKSSSSRGERQYIENNNILDDQISSESNIDEIMPSPTLLLQTSYTTFTYFTTMYIGKDASKVKSRLETITNVVTETITPKKEPEEESNLPITYYTTFTYWTTLYKDKTTTITSREEIVSNIVTPVVQVAPTISPIDTTPIDVESVLPPKGLEVEIKPSLINDTPEQDDGKATFYTTYTYFTTFYAGNSSQIRSSLQTVTNVVDNTKIIEDNQLGRKVPTGAVDKNLIQDNGEKPNLSPTIVKEEIQPTKLPDLSAASPTVLVGTYIDNLYAEVKPADVNTVAHDTDKKIIFSQVAVISGDSVIVTSDNKTLSTESTLTTDVSNGTTTTESTIISPTPEVIESSVADPDATTESPHESEDEEEEDDGTNPRKKSRLTYTTKKPSFTPVIIPFASRNRPTFSPKRVSLLSSATTITRADFTPTITATPTLKSVRPSGFGGSRKPSFGGSSSSVKRFSGRSSISNPSANVPSASRSGGFGNRPSIQPTSRRTGFRSSSIRSNNLDFASRSAGPRIRPTASSRLRGNRNSASISLPPQDQNESDTSGTQLEENVTEPLNEVTEAPVRTTNNPLNRFRRPPVARQPGTAVTPRVTTASTRRTSTSRGRITTTTRRPTTRSTTNPLLSLRRQRPNSALFPRKNLLKQPEPEQEEEIKQNEQEVEESEELQDGEEFEEDNDYESSDRKEQQVVTPSTPAPRKNTVQIRPFAFRRRTKRQVDYGNRKYSNFRRPSLKSATTKAADLEPETEPPAPVTQKARPGSRFNSRLSSQSKTTTAAPQKSSQRQPFIIRGESKTTASHRQTTTATPAYRRNKSRPSSRTTTSSTRPKAPKLLSRNSQTERSRSPPRSSTSRSRTRTTTSRGSSRQRNSFENFSGERQNYKNIVDNGKLTVTYQIPTEVTIPVVNGKITEYKNVLTAKPSIEVLLRNQVATTLGPLGNQQLVLASESTKLAENGATEIVKFYLHETPTTTVIFTPTTIRGRKTSYSHILPSTVYNVEPVTQTIGPEINANVPLANLLLSQLLLGNQQPAINPLLALQGQGLLPQQPMVQTPVTEFKTRTTTYVTTVTDARETVLPITFKGRAILTTIVDPTTNVITATEYVTDTIVTTPTALAPPPQFNSLLLPLLLQQQQQQQQAIALQTPNPLLGLAQNDLNLLHNNNLNNDIYSNSPKPNILPDLNSNEDFSEEIQEIEEDVPPPPPPTRTRNKPRAPKPAPPKLTSVVTMYVSGRYPAFNTNGIVYDNSPWRPGREIDLVEQGNSEDERRFKNLATKVLSNGVEVLVKDKNDGKQEQRKLKLMQVTSFKPPFDHSSLPSKSLLSSAVATFFNHQQMSALFPLHQLMQHNYIIKTCMTTYTYLTTVVQNKRSDVSTFESIVSVVTTESLTNLPLYATDLFPSIKPTNTKYMEMKTIKPSSPVKLYQSNFVKIEKRIDSDNGNSFDLIQPSEASHTSCTSSCSCSQTKTESLKTKYSNNNDHSAPAKHAIKTSKFDSTKLEPRPTNKETLDKKTKYSPYEYESGSHLAPTDKVVEKYTEVNDYSDEKNTNSVEESELLTNEQAPAPPKPSKAPVTNSSDKHKLEKPQKPNKSKFVVADLLKLGSLGIKGLSQLAPVLEKMTGGFIKRQENRTTTSTVKPITKLTAYSVDKRIDTDMETKGNFPIYIPVDELETAESQIAFTNATLHQNLAWAAEHKHPKARIAPPKMIHESPLVNGGIPISPGEIITANSDVIVGRPAVGGPLTLAASGIKLQNPVNPPILDSFVAGDEQYIVQENPPSNEQNLSGTKVDDSFDLRPPDLPKSKQNPIRNSQRPSSTSYNYHNSPPPKNSPRPSKPSILGNHGRPAFLDYIPSLARPENQPQDSDEIPDNSPSSSEVISTRVRVEEGYPLPDHNMLMNKPFLVDIQPSRVANVLIPHGSSTALVFAGSSEPHKTGDYVDDPLPYPEPGYFGSFSIDAPQMTNVHNAPPNSNKQFGSKPTQRPLEPYKPNPQFYKNHTFKNDQKIKWKESKNTFDFHKIPPPTSNQETYVQVGPQITAYNPNVYHHNNGDFEHYSNGRGKEKQKEVIDNEYENYLAVPPPPPKMHFSHDNSYDKNKPYLQKPIVHTKPVQDMKVFLNIQHPIPNSPPNDQQPPKITSEIYFASQIPSSKPTPVYTVHIPPAGSQFGNSFNQPQDKPHSHVSVNHGHIQGSVSADSIPYANKSITNNGLEKDGTYTVILNTTNLNATNVASNSGEPGQVIGSSVPVSIGNAPKYGEMNTDIPISTNFAIRVEDDATHSETHNLHSNQNPSQVYDHGREPIKVSMGDNRWNTSSLIQSEPTNKKEQNDIYYHHNDKHNKPSPSIAPSLNSHANFPMMKDITTPSNEYNNIKPVTEYQEDIKNNEPKRPAKLIPNIPTNSHGWYSSVPLNENILNSVNNIKVEATTRKIIPLLHDYNRDNLPKFGQKISSAGKPPSEFWGPEKSPVLTHHGKPFTRPNDHQVVYSSQPPITNKPFSPKYIPSNFGVTKQPAYDIPIRDNSDETTTTKYTQPTAAQIKPVFENSEEIYDGEEEIDNNSEIDREVSQESMKVPVVSTSSEMELTSKATTQLVLLQDEVIQKSPETQKDTNVNLVDFNPGTQTEKPFRSYNKTTFSSNTIKPINGHNPYMNPRPFTANTITTLDHQLHQPHWQINQMMENSTNASYEENLELNTGEEMSTLSTNKPSTTRKVPYYRPEPDNKYKRPPRPVFSARPNNSLNTNDPHIITSTVQIQDKKPLIVEKPNEKTTLPTFTITTDLDINRTSSEIIDLSPPPPTMDYNFKPSTNDEMIMGMSPPPPRTPPAIRQPVKTTPRPTRTPPSYKTLPPRTFTPRSTTQRPTRKPFTRDDVSTYRPPYNILNNIKRPVYNPGLPSSQLLPPPREPSRVIPVNEVPTEKPKPSNVIFPTPVSSGWLTSSGVEFVSDFEFEPTSIQFPEAKPSQIPELHEVSSSESSSYEAESSRERFDNDSSVKPVTQEGISDSSKEGTDNKVSFTIKEPVSTESVTKESQEDVSTERIKFGSGGFRNRTRKPYPSQDSTNKYRVTTKHTTTTIKPIRPRPEILYPTRPNPNKKIPQIKPIPQRPVIISPSSIIESSESPVEEDFIKPTEVLKESSLPSITQLEATNVIEKIPASDLASGIDNSFAVKPTHHAGNEVKVFDEIIPTKTEFKTTIVTLTKTLSEPPQTVSSIGYVNLTHTLTVTHTKTSLLSQSEGAVTQTLVLTNTHTSTIVDVVTEVYTHVQPTTIIETVTKHIPIPLDPTPVVETATKTKLALDDVTMSSEETDNFIIKDGDTIENVQKVQTDSDNDSDTFFVVMNKSQNGGQAPPIQTDIETGDYDGVTRNEQVTNNGVSQVLFGEILLAGTPYLETNVGHPTGTGYGKECQPDCKASRNERCQRIDGLMKCVCRPGFARMFPDRPCKPTYTYSVKLALGTQGNQRLQFHDNLADNSSKQYQALAFATHEGINRMVMQSDLRDVFHGVHITGFHPIEMRSNGELFQGVMNDFYVQLSDNAHESRLKEVIEKYLRHNNYSLGGTDVHAAGELVDRLEVNDFDECVSGQFHDCSEHSQCFNLRGTYTCSCLEGYADLSVNSLYPGRICSAEPVGCERCNYHGACYSRDDHRVLCECFQWYAGSACHINLKVVLISLVVVGALLTVVLAVCAVVACSRRPRPPPHSIVACIQSMPGLHQGAMPSKQRADRRALISERADSGDASSVQNASLPYMPAKRPPGKKCVMSEPPAHEPPPPPAPAVMIPRARLLPHHSDSNELSPSNVPSRENISRKKSLELSSEAKLISYLESGAVNASSNDEMRRKHSMESSYSAMKERHNKQGALVSAGFKVSTTIRPDEPTIDRDDSSSVHKDMDDMRFDSLRKSYSQEDLSEWTDAERRLGELTLSEARSVGGTLPASTGRAASSTRLTHQEANTMAERDLGSTFLLPHVHLYKPDLTSDVSEFDSL